MIAKIIYKGTSFACLYGRQASSQPKTTRLKKYKCGSASGVEKQKEILDSIHYAKRIQTALIPSEQYIDKSLNKLRSRF